MTKRKRWQRRRYRACRKSDAWWCANVERELAGRIMPGSVEIVREQGKPPRFLAMAPGAITNLDPVRGVVAP